MKFKLKDKVVINPTSTGWRNLRKRGIYGTIELVHPRNWISQKQIYTVYWQNSAGQPVCAILNLNRVSMFEGCLSPYFKSDHNHPLTSIFADKMPVKKKRLTKPKKRGKVLA